MKTKESTIMIHEIHTEFISLTIYKDIISLYPVFDQQQLYKHIYSVEYTLYNDT